MRAYLYNNTAWFLLTTPYLLLRNPQEAHQLATRAVDITGRNEPLYLDTLAESQFVLGRFTEALWTGQEALELAPDKPHLTSQIRKFRQALE